MNSRQSQHFAALTWNLLEGCSVSAPMEARGQSSKSLCPDGRNTEHSMLVGEGGVASPQGSHLCWVLCAFTLKLCEHLKFAVLAGGRVCGGRRILKPPLNVVPQGTRRKSHAAHLRGHEFKSCHSALREQHLCWRFEGAIMGVALVFACLVIVVSDSWTEKLWK
ncbi:hypothetical protein GH733_013610, partial [Mirounga leonina]